MPVIDTWVAQLNISEPPLASEDTPEVVHSPGTLAWWPSSTAYGNIMSVSATIPTEARLVWSNEYPAKKTASGQGEQCIFQVHINLPDQLFPDVWIADRIASTFQDKIKEKGADILDLKIYIDTSPTWTTDYYVVALIKPAATSRALTFPFPWAVVISLILVLLIIVAFTWTLIEIKEVDLGKIVAGVTIPVVAVAAVVGTIGLLMLASPGKKVAEGGAKRGT